MKQYHFNKTQWYRFEHLCKLLGLIVQTDANYTYSNELFEIERCYLRVIRNNEVIALAYLID